MNGGIPTLPEQLLQRVNALLVNLAATDPDTLARLREFGDLAIDVYLSLPPLALGLRVRNGMVALARVGNAEVRVQGNAWDLLAMARGDAHKLRIDGDLERVQPLLRIFSQAHPDIRRELSVWLGDAGANWLYDSGRSLLSGDPLARLGRWLQGESTLLAEPERVEDWLMGVQQLRLELEHLEVRLQHREQHS